MVERARVVDRDVAGEPVDVVHIGADLVFIPLNGVDVKLALQIAPGASK